MGKKILLVGLDYFDYTREIVNALVGLGNEVHFHDIQPPRLPLKVLRKFAPSKYPQALDIYHREILRIESDFDPDIVLFIQVHQMSMSTIADLRLKFSKAEFILYNWDAYSNHDYRPYLDFFDRTYTFDPVDAKTLGINYLPLFCIPSFLNLKKPDQRCKSIYMVGNIANPRRYEVIQAFKEYCNNGGIVFRSHMVASTHAYWNLCKLGHFPVDVSFRRISGGRFIDLIESSTAVFDFANHRQSGFTMRTIENLCAGKKIVTNNPLIVHESFYSPDRIHVFSDMDFSGISDFLERPLQSPDSNFPEFHLDQFVRFLIGAR